MTGSRIQKGRFRARNHIQRSPGAGKLDQTIDSESLACVMMVFVMGLMHMETLLPQLVGDANMA
ncbi:MAG: hypothetical protein WB586_11720 [Chthoniobacterales bacterium]